jgi:hypothetical protein
MAEAVAIGAFGTANVYEIIMVDSGKPKAVPSLLGSDNSSFSV